MTSRAALITAAVALLAAGCGGSSGSPSAPATTGSGASSGSASVSPSAPSPSPTPSATATTSRRPTAIYLVRGEHLVAVQREPVVTDGAVATAAVTALLAGPTGSERAAGITTAVPSATALHGVTVAGGIADVDLSSRFAAGGGSLSMTARVAQVTYTVTQFASVQRVTFRIDGAPVTALGGEGLVLDKPVTRASFTTLLPPVFVDVPARGAVIWSPVRVSGLADVFEGQVLVEIRDNGGHVLARGTGHAAMGMFAPFAVPLTFSVATARPGSVVAYHRSAKDGSVQDLVRVPVTLRP